MNAYDLTVSQLKRVPPSRNIEALKKELSNILGAAANAGAATTKNGL